MPVVFLPDLALALLVLGVFITDLIWTDTKKGERLCWHMTWAGLLVIFGLQIGVAWDPANLVGQDIAQGNYRLRPWTIPFRLVAVLAALLTCWLLHSFFAGRSRRDIIKAPGVTLVMILIITLGSFVLSTASDLITFVIGLEMATIPLYTLAAFSRDRIGAEASVKYLLIGGLSTAFMLFGCSYLYGVTGTLFFEPMAERLADQTGNPLALVGLLFVLAALAFKLSAVPFHMWAPDIYSGSPSAVTALIASGSKAAGIMALLLLLLEPLGSLYAAGKLDAAIIIMAVVSMLVGNLGALKQKQFNRFMAYSSIAQVGFLLLAFLGTELMVPALAFYLLVYLLGNFAAFFVFNILSERRDETMVSLHGLARQSPLLALCLLLAMFSLAGIPPLGGFLGKFQLLLAAAEGHHYVLILFAAINAVIGLYYYMMVVKQAYVVEPQATPQDIAISFPQRFALLVLAAGLLITGIWSGPHRWIGELCHQPVEPATTVTTISADR